MASIADRARAYVLDESFARVPIDLGRTTPTTGATRLSANAPAGSLGIEIVLPCEVHEHFAGGGETFDQLDKRGRVIQGCVGASVNKAVDVAPGLDGGYKVAPLWYSSAGYAAFVEGTRQPRIELAVRNPHEVVVRLLHDELAVVVVDGDPADAIRVVTELTGRPPLAPPWAYGVWHGIRGGHDATVAEAKRLRDEGVGCSAIWLDAHYEPDTNSGFPAAGTYPLGEYPDIAGTVRLLHDMGFKVLTYVNPFLYKNTPAYEHAAANGYAVADAEGNPIRSTGPHPFEGDFMGLFEQTGIHSLPDAAGIVDFTNPDARAWWQGLLRKILTDEDFDGWMEDFGEVVCPQAVMHDGTHADTAHNRYPLLYHEASAQEIARTKPDALQFCRGGWLGAQRFGKVFWPGDQTRDWSHEAGLPSVLAAGISIGLMGVAAWGPDIGANMGFPSLGGGYGGGSQDAELWLRWCQLGAMTPVMRDHLSFHSGVPVDLWTDEETVDCWRRCAAWHTGLFPYLYSHAHEASATGMPIMRGLMLGWPADPECWAANHDYLLGDALLCAPVFEKGATARRVYLPQGTWIDAWTGDAHEGPGFIEVPAPIDRWPHLQLAGTVVPRLADVPLDLNDQRFADGDFDLELRVAPGGSSERTLFDGTRIALDGETVRVHGPRERRIVAATPDGHRIDEASGSDVTLRAR